MSAVGVHCLAWIMVELFACTLPPLLGEMYLHRTTEWRCGLVLVRVVVCFCLLFYIYFIFLYDEGREKGPCQMPLPGQDAARSWRHLSEKAVPATFSSRVRNELYPSLVTFLLYRTSDCSFLFYFVLLLPFILLISLSLFWACLGLLILTWAGCSCCACYSCPDFDDIFYLLLLSFIFACADVLLFVWTWYWSW